MLDLSQLDLKTSYHKGYDDIARDFYLPCMQRASHFDRAVGYFRSTIFVIAWPALKGFIQRGGKIHILCSQVLADDDVEALQTGYDGRGDRLLGEKLREEIAVLLRDEALKKPARVLAGLVANGILDVQIAVLREGDLSTAKKRIFHDKLGIFRDQNDHRVVFKGSMNETWAGLSADGNLEFVDVAASWLGTRDLERCIGEETYFKALWERRYPGLLVRSFPDVARSELDKVAPVDVQEAIDELFTDAKELPASDSRGRTLKSHQASGLASWSANDRRGILAFATGAGKTFTAIRAIRDALTKFKNVVVVVVPDQTLFVQWEREIIETTKDLEPRLLRVGAGHNQWRKALRQWTVSGAQRRIVLATVQTASTEDFRQKLAGGSHILIVADEVHRLGSDKHQELMDDQSFGPRLGLSATPERFGDIDGTAAILKFFGGVLKPRYSLSDAIRDGVLTPYFYRPHALRLEQDEAELWMKLTNDAARIFARNRDKELSTRLIERAQRLLIERARVIKQARAKVRLAMDVVSQSYSAGDRWIVYCDDNRQLADVNRSLTAIGVQVFAYHSAMDGDRAQTLRWFARHGGIITAIRCLDEGVDIPEITHALILASSKNPREFIQRRGRVLRRAEGKALAHIHDAIVLPPKTASLDAKDGWSDQLVFGELARAIEFSTFASNPAAGADLRQIAIKVGIDWAKVAKLGEEDEENGT